MKRFLALVLSLALVCSMLLALPAAAEELPTLKVLGGYVNFDPNNDPTATDIEATTGYHVEYSMLPAENATENLMMQIASGESYDILRIAPDQYRALLEMGALLPLDDLLAAHGPNLTSLITEEAFELVKKDGQIYGLPMMAEREVIGTAIIYRQDIMDELGLEMPTTPEAFKEMLQAVKAAYPDMIPLCLTGNIWVPTLVSGFGFYNAWEDRDGKIVNYQQLPEYKEYLAYFRNLYANRWMYQDFNAINHTRALNLFTSGKAGAIMYNNGASVDHVYNQMSKEQLLTHPH